MTETKQTLRTKIEAELSIGKTPRELSKKYTVGYQTILQWKKKLEGGKADKDLEAIVSADEQTLHLVADRLKDSAPADIAKKIDAVVDGAVSLQQLEPKFHAVVLNLLTKAEELSDSDDLSIKDWKILGDGISNMYANIFNKSGVSVNVMNQTQVSGEKLSLFKASMR